LDLEARQRLLDELCASDEKFYGWADDVYANCQLDPLALALILELVRPGDRTLETGAGYSTVAFALVGAAHTVVAPFETEQARIREWCTAHGVDTSQVRFVVGQSQWLLPTLEPASLDFVLVDGDHAFPVPFIDWYYAAEHLRVGGLVMIDDIPLRTGAVLDDFLHLEASRWRVVARLPRTVIYEKLTPTVLDFAGWMTQAWCMRNPSLIGRMRDRVRLRTRLRALAGRRGP
jgi:predicted O-methyltransferase YrrM